jgi:hypothetical protein
MADSIFSASSGDTESQSENCYYFIIIAGIQTLTGTCAKDRQGFDSITYQVFQLTYDIQSIKLFMAKISGSEPSILNTL